MYNEPREQDEEEMGGGGLRSHLGRWWDQMRGRGEDEEAYDDGPVISAVEHPPVAPRRDTFRVAAIKGSITVTQVANFGDTQKVADRLKGGEPQVVNLEDTPPEVAERLIDFLNGVTYALDGYVEKVAESAYLFTPAHIAIHAEGPEPPQPKPFFDRL
jgi:FtsZ-interacting cell division protein YlmF